MLKRVCCFLNPPCQKNPTKIHLEALSLLLVEKKIWGLALLYKWTLSNKNLVLVLLELKFKSVSHGRLSLRSTCKYLRKIFIFIWNKRKILSPGIVTEKFVSGTKTMVWTHYYNLFLFIFLPEIWERKSLTIKQGHVQVFAENAWGKFTTLTFNEHNQWLQEVWLAAKLICLCIPSEAVISHLGLLLFFSMIFVKLIFCQFVWQLCWSTAKWTQDRNNAKQPDVKRLEQ